MTTTHTPTKQWRGKDPTEFTAGEQNEVKFSGWLLAGGSSRRDSHTHDMTDHAATGERCAACRWFVADLYLTADDPRGRYVVITVGRTRVPDEDNYWRVSFTDSAYEIVELLTIRKTGSEPLLPGVSARTLARASEFDERIRDAYVNRAVV